MNRTPLPLALAALAVVALAPPGPARASVPGNEEQLARSGLQHVCVDLEPGDEGYVQCNDQGGGGPTGLYTGSECVTAGLPPTCVVDYVPKTVLKAKLFMIEDEDAADNEGNFQSAAGIVVEIKIKGKKHVLVELFAGEFDGTQIGNWNDLTEDLLTSTAVNVDFNNEPAAYVYYQYANQSLEEIGLAIRDLAHAAWPTRGLDTAIPVFLGFDRGDEDEIVNRSEFADLLASGAPFDLTIGFARLRP
jgi:hypothetical protein